jgi:hypothetical protein
MDERKLIRNETKIVKTITSNIKMELQLEKYARISLKRCKIHRKQLIGYTVEKQITELESMGTYKCLGVDGRHNIEHEKENDKLKECVRRFKIDFEHSAKGKGIGTLAILVLSEGFGIITGIKKKYKNWPEIQGKFQPSTDSSTH